MNISTYASVVVDDKKNKPIFPCFLVRFFVAVPEGSLSHFQDPIRSYLEGYDDELESARSTVTLT